MYHHFEEMVLENMASGYKPVDFLLWFGIGLAQGLKLWSPASNPPLGDSGDIRR